MASDGLRPNLPLLAGGLSAIRRHIHRHPESGVDQPETVAFIAGRLRELGLQPDTSKVGCVGAIVGAALFVQLALAGR